jgi:hypothetical protein
MTPRTAQPWRRSPTRIPKVRGRAVGISRSRKSSRRLVKGRGFSSGWAEFALKNPPPLVPSSLMASWEATGPPSRCWVPPPSVVTAVWGSRFCTTPAPTRTRAAMKEIGRRIRVTDRVRSVQKLPIRASVPERAKPRTSAIATERPTAAETKFWTAKPAIWSRCPAAASPEYHCQLVFVVKLTAVFQAPAGSRPVNPRFHGRCAWRRPRAYRARTEARENPRTDSR